MKFIRLLGNFYRRNIVGAVILFCVITFSLFLMIDVMGIVRYIAYSRDVFVHSGLNGCYYFMSVSSSTEDRDKETKQVLEKVKQTEGVNQVFSLSGASLIHDTLYIVGATAMSPEFAARFRPAMESGQWLADNYDLPPGTFPAVAVASKMKDVHVGDTLEFTVPRWKYDESGNRAGTTVTTKASFYIVGTLGDFGYVPFLGYSGSNVTTDNFLHPSMDGLIFLDTPETQELVMRDNPGNLTDVNWFVLLDDGLTQEQQDACLTELKAYGQIASTGDILANTDDLIHWQLKISLPYPLFAIIVSTFCFFSLSILFVQKKLEEASVYALCGCSNKKNFAIAAVGLGLIGTLACLTASIVMAKYYEDYKFLALINMQDYNIYVDYKSYLYLFAYLVLMLAISLAVPFLARRKMSPIELYRRKTQ